jgi:2-methylfumaryl-CoA hydratase
MVLDYVRWVMVRKRDPAAPAPDPVVPSLPAVVAPEQLTVPADLDFSDYDAEIAGAADFWQDYAPGERIDHVDGITIEEAEHQLATRLYQNTAKIHFNQFLAAQDRLGRRLVYGGHIISLARSLSFNGLANACLVAAINGGRHVNPTLAGDTIHAWSEVLAKAALPGRDDLGALRLRTIATKDRACADFPGAAAGGASAYPPEIVLDLDYWVLMPKQ